MFQLNLVYRQPHTSSQSHIQNYTIKVYENQGFFVLFLKIKKKKLGHYLVDNTLIKNFNSYIDDIQCLKFKLSAKYSSFLIL